MKRAFSLCIALAFLFSGMVIATAQPSEGTGSPAVYRVGTACDDAWQEGPFPGTSSGINPSADYKWTYAPVGWDDVGHIFNPGLRFENVQLAAHQTVTSATFSAEFVNDFSYTALDVPVEVELADAADICQTNDLIYHRTFSAPTGWHTTTNSNGGAYTTIDLTALVQQAVNSASWRQGGSILVRLVGEDDRALYPYSKGWNLTTWDAHNALPPLLMVQS